MMCFAAVIWVILMFLNSMQCTSDLAPNLSDDAIKIMRAFESEGLWCGEKIIDILIARTNDQRQGIIKAFKKHSKMDLIRELNRHFYFETKEAVTTLMIPNEQFYAYQIHQAIEGFGTDEDVISQILGSMNNEEILNVSAVYENVYGVTLRDDLISDTSGPFMQLLMALCNAQRDETHGYVVNRTDAITDAQVLVNACRYSENKYHANETAFITIFTTRPRELLVVIFEEFSKLSNKTIEEAIRKEFLGEVQYGLLILVRYATFSKVQFYANQLEECMAGFGTDDHQLMRIIIGRSEIDLKEIEKAYQNIYGISLMDRVDDETSGKYRYLLLAVLRK